MPRHVTLFVVAVLVLGGVTPAGAAAQRAPGVHFSSWSPGQPATPFTMVAVSWRGSAPVAARVRVSPDGQQWSDWQDVIGEPEDRPDAGSPEDQGVHSLGPLWTGPSQFADVALTGEQPDSGVRVDLIDTSTARRPAGGGVQAASATHPAIVTRAQWGADESIRHGAVSYATRVQVAFVHHTATSNNYSAADVPGILQSIYAYHAQVLGWHDIGYNFLIDRFGTVYEGRYGGIDRGVIGAHALGFNSRSTGIALIGDFTYASPPKVMLDALTNLLAWKLDVHHIDPRGSSAVVSTGSDLFEAGQTATLANVSGHRDVDQTACPGATVYPLLPGLAAAAAATGLPKFYGGFPSPSPANHAPDGTWPPIAFNGTTTTPTAWSLTVTTPGGTTLAAFEGTGTVVSALWQPVDTGGTPLPPGDYPYTITLGPGFTPESDVVSLGPIASFDTYILVGNPSVSETAQVQLDLATVDGDVVTHNLAVAPSSRRTVFLNDVLPHSEMSTHLSSTIPVVAERAMYFDYQDTDPGGSDAVGARQPATTWDFAEGYTAPGFDEYLTLQNPGLTSTRTTIDYLFPGGTTQHTEMTLPATSRTTVTVAEVVGRGKEVSTHIEADAPIVAERPIYYQTERWKGGDVVLGVSEPSPRWYFAEGYTGPGFDEYLTVANPSLTPTTYSVTYLGDDGVITTTEHTMAAHARDTVDVRREAGDNREVSMLVEASQPVVAERPMYFTYGTGIRDGHDSTGVAAPSSHLYFAEGFTGAGFTEYLTLLNPSPVTNTVTARYLPADGPPRPVAHDVAPLGRLTVNVADDVGLGREVSVELTATSPVVAERPMYFDYYGVWDGGHVATGVSAPSTDWYFAEGFTG